MQSVSGAGDSFPSDQCTFWASFRYHQMTGYYIPWSGNANEWAGNAAKYGWINSSAPVVPSIVCLQSGVQEADPNFGHVGVVEKLNSDGTITASNLNWGLSAAARSRTVSVKFRSGAGVSFIYAVDANGQPISVLAGAGPAPTNGVAARLLDIKDNIQIGPNEDVAAYLYAADVALELRNPFDTANMNLQDIVILGTDVGPNPVSYAADVATNLVQDGSALIIRTGFIIVGMFVLWFVVNNVMSKKISETVGGPQGIMQVVGALA